MARHRQARFTTALCDYLQGLGLPVDFHQSMQLDGHMQLELTIKNLDPKSADEYQKEMEDLAREVCTNG